MPPKRKAADGAAKGQAKVPRGRSNSFGEASASSRGATPSELGSPHPESFQGADRECPGDQPVALDRLGRHPGLGDKQSTAAPTEAATSWNPAGSNASGSSSSSSPGSGDRGTNRHSSPGATSVQVGGDHSAAADGAGSSSQDSGDRLQSPDLKEAFAARSGERARFQRLIDEAEAERTTIADETHPEVK